MNANAGGEKLSPPEVNSKTATIDGVANSETYNRHPVGAASRLLGEPLPCCSAWDHVASPSAKSCTSAQS
jgi:hypothetical protein